MLVGFPLRQFQLCKGDAATETKIVKKTIEVPVKKMIKKKVEETVTENILTNRQVMVDGKLIMKQVSVPTLVKKLVEKEVEETVMEKKEVEEPITAWVHAESDCIWVDEQAVSEYIRQGYKFTGQKRMSYCPPEWIADKKGSGILILDDWTRKIN